MKSLFDIREHYQNLRQLVVWTLLVIPVGILAGSASAFFLWSLEKATELRWEYGWLLFFLPVAGVGMAFLDQWLGKSAKGGNNLILDRIHEPGGGVPTRMAPLVLFGTVVTHLFGGSAGREGTAVQMGGSLASAYGRLCRFGEKNMRVLLMAGVAAGFGSVFGTPLTGAVFAMEVLVIGRTQYDALIPVLVASLVGDFVCGLWGIHHTTYHIAIADPEHIRAILDLPLLGKAALAAVAFGLASKLFAELTHGLQRGFGKVSPHVPVRAALGAGVVIGLVYLLGTRDYIGLGVHNPDPEGVTLISAFQEGGAAPFSWWWKLLFTAVTLSVGFKGGEVTPLFFIGATLGNTLGTLLGAPIDLFACLGLVAVFAGATNTPLACTLMGIELFGSHYAIYFAVASFVAYYCSGHSGIYSSQRLGIPKNSNAAVPEDVTLKELQAIHGVAATGFEGEGGSEVTVLGLDQEAKSTLSRTETGKIRIYLEPDEKVPSKGIIGKLSGKSRYREVVKAAKEAGLSNAAVFTTHYGFVNSGAADETVPLQDPRLTICVELIDTKERLEVFCKGHADLLSGKTIIYKHVEDWGVEKSVLEARDASPNQVVDGQKKRLESDR